MTFKKDDTDEVTENPSAKLVLSSPTPYQRGYEDGLNGHLDIEMIPSELYMLGWSRALYAGKGTGE